MQSNELQEKKELTTQELAQVAGGAIRQPRNESAQPNPDPALTPGTPTSITGEPALGDPAEGLTEA